MYILIRRFFALLVIISFLHSCNNNCDCSEEWDSSITYVIDDLVSHNDTCWVSKGRGRGVKPGPWLENGNDIWLVCDD